MVTISVGPDGAEEKSVIHKCVLESLSPFFAAAFNSNFEEGRTQLMRLADVEAAEFGLIVHWMYQKEIEGGAGVRILRAAQLWTLADRFMMSKLQNAAMDVIRGLLCGKDQPDSKELLQVVELSYTPKVDSQLKRIVPRYIAGMPLHLITGWIKKGPNEMAQDVTFLLRRQCERLEKNNGTTPKAHSIERIPLSTEYHVEEVKM